MANYITSIRVICSIMLLFCKSCSFSFYLIYIIAGLTDMVDGTIARKTNSVSEFGSKLDTVADFTFITVCLIKFIHIIKFENWMYLWMLVIAIIKVINVIVGYVIRKKLAAVHSIMNKIVGALLFTMPLTLNFIELKYSVFVICTIATIAAIQEGYYIRVGKKGVVSINRELRNERSLEGK